MTCVISGLTKLIPRSCLDCLRVRTAEAFDEPGDEFMRLKVEGIRDCGELPVTALMDRRDEPISGRRTLPEMDLAAVTCAIQNIWLAARAEGMGMGWVSLFDPTALAQLRRIPAAGRPVAVLRPGDVEAFYPRPMPEQAGWCQGFPLREFLYQNHRGQAAGAKTMKNGHDRE